jgi:predicted aldo/keto reductase-like oxidoreductase
MKHRAISAATWKNTLRKLRTDYLDVYLIHNVEIETFEKIKERRIIEEYEKFRAEGLIRAIGFSYHGSYQGFQEIMCSYSWDMCRFSRICWMSSRK